MAMNAGSKDPARDDVIRIGSGAGFSGDRIDPAVALAREGNLDYLVFECLAERTIALAVTAQCENPENGYDPFLRERLSEVLPAAVPNRVRIISNMGAANPLAAAREIARVVRDLKLGPLKIAAVTGDDVLSHMLSHDSPLMDAAGTVHSWPGELISANAYLGADGIVRALDEGADIVVTGRVADPSLFLAPLIHEFGWAPDDWGLLGRGTVVGHLLECAGQITGGYFADPGYKEVPGLHDLGFPLAEVSPDGSAVITKLRGSGGCVSLATCKEQLLYELHDPTRYITPDVTADFSTVGFTELAPDRILVQGGGGRPRPDRLKVTLGYREGYAGEGQISYAGPGAMGRALLARQILEQRLRGLGPELLDLRFDLIGVNSIGGDVAPPAAEPPEVRVRAAGRTKTAAGAIRVGREVEALYTNGPAGGGGASRSMKPVTAVVSTLIDRSMAEARLHWEIVE